MLLRLYCSLVTIEIALKDHFQPWRAGHRLIDWLNDIGEKSLGLQLEGKLSALTCTGRDGSETIVGANSYPDIRYLRHESDFTGKSTDFQINEVLQIVADIEAALRNKGFTHI